MLLTEEFGYSKMCSGWVPATDVLLQGGRRVLQKWRIR
jgi:hypothetical protein